MSETVPQWSAEEEHDWEARRDEAAMVSAPVRLMRALEAVRHIVALTSSRINVLSADAKPGFLSLTIVGRAHAREIAEHFAGDRPIQQVHESLWFDWSYLGTEYVVRIGVELNTADQVAAKRAELEALEAEVAS